MGINRVREGGDVAPEGEEGNRKRTEPARCVHHLRAGSDREKPKEVFSVWGLSRCMEVRAAAH